MGFQAVFLLFRIYVWTERLPAISKDFLTLCWSKHIDTNFGMDTLPEITFTSSPLKIRKSKQMPHDMHMGCKSNPNAVHSCKYHCGLVCKIPLKGLDRWGTVLTRCKTRSLNQEFPISIRGKRQHNPSAFIQNILCSEHFSKNGKCLAFK